MKYIRSENCNPFWLYAHLTGRGFSDIINFMQDDIASLLRKEHLLLFRVLSSKNTRKILNSERTIFIRRGISNESYGVFTNWRSTVYGGTFESNDFAYFRSKFLSLVKQTHIHLNNDEYLVIDLSSYDLGGYDRTNEEYTRQHTKYKCSMTKCRESDLPVGYVRKMYIDKAIKEC